MLSNSVSSIDDIGFHLLDERIELSSSDQHAVRVAPEVLDRYVGVYELTQGGTVTVTHTKPGWPPMQQVWAGRRFTRAAKPSSS